MVSHYTFNLHLGNIIHIFESLYFLLYQLSVSLSYWVRNAWQRVSVKLMALLLFYIQIQQ